MASPMPTPQLPCRLSSRANSRSLFVAWCQGVTTNASLSTKVLDITLSPALPANCEARPFAEVSSLAISASRDSASDCMAMGFQRKWRDR